MAQAPGQAPPSSGQGIGALARGFFSLGNAQKVGLAVALAAAIALVVVAFLWARTAEYRVLYSNLSERDGGEVIAALAQQNVPYRVAEGGSVILVPGDRVYELRLQLAAQGLPKGGAVGFELMDAQKFGISQFAEQVNYQRALAGELSRTVQSIAAVQGARVHLAIPRPTRVRARPAASQRLGAGEPVSGPRAGRWTGQRNPAPGRQQCARSWRRAMSPWWTRAAICFPGPRSLRPAPAAWMPRSSSTCTRWRRATPRASRTS